MPGSNIVICKCGTWNRIPATTQAASRVICCDCGNSIISLTANSTGGVVRGERIGSPTKRSQTAALKPRTSNARRSFLPIILVLVIVGALPFVIGKLTSNATRYAHNTPVPERSNRPVAPTPAPLSKTVALPPQSAPPPTYVAPAPITPARPAVVPENEHLSTPKFNLITAAPGCPQKLPSYASIQAYCRPLDEGQCIQAKQNCYWLKSFSRLNGTVTPAECIGKQGTFVPPPPPGPAAMARLGIRNLPPPMLVTTSEITRRVADGEAFNANKRFSAAISAYTEALKANPEHVPALIGRARAYEAKHDNEHAIADYCRLLLLTLDYATYSSAVKQVAKLAGLEPVDEPRPVPPQGASAPDRRALPLPRTSSLENSSRKNRIAPLSIETESGTNYVIKLINVAEPRNSIMIFVRGGEPYSTKVPLGTYRIHGASGSTWYGKDDLFGPNTRYFRLQSKSGSDAEGSVTFHFRREGNQIFGMTFVFKNVIAGNMTQESISRDDF